MAVKKRDFRPVWERPGASLEVRLAEGKRLLVHFKKYNKQPHLNVWKEYVKILERQLKQGMK